MRAFPPVLLVPVLVLAARAATAQSADQIEALTAGRHAISFTARTLEHGGNAGLGFWRVRAPDRSTGWLVSVATDYVHNSASGFLVDSAGNIITSQSSSSTSFAATVGPAFRHYLAVAAPVAPFIETDVSLGLGYTSVAPTSGSNALGSHTWTPSVGGSIAGGAEWFPLKRISVAGQAGIRADLSYSHGHASVGSLPSLSQWRASLGTFISALTLQIYF